ncbi:MAG: hypothetical protein JRJ87_21460 [Deltaproteobacteria bacterium]|nr:hypothetical protein [Deltaproteobacteria bacterium]
MSEDRQTLDYQVQIRRLNEIIDSWGAAVHSFRLDDPGSFSEEIKLSARGAGAPSVVVGDAVGAELGRPGCDSHAVVLTTTNLELVSDGLVRCVGPDFDEVGPQDHLPLAQIVVLAHEPEQVFDPFELDSTQYLANRLQGYMARTVPGRLWVRASREIIENGFRLRTLGFALLAAYLMDFSQALKAEVILVTGPPEKVKELGPIAAEARVLSGQHRKLTLIENGTYECEDLNCEDCDERDTCDSLRDVYVRYRKRGRG